MEDHERNDGLTSVMDLRNRSHHSREELRKAYSAHKEINGIVGELDKQINVASQRLADLKTGFGNKIISSHKVEVYEFWLNIPGYSGSIEGAKAQLVTHGSLEHVSNVSNETKSGLTGAVIGGVLLGPLGAAAGVLATRKNKITTRVDRVDTRQVELQIQGPGYAWSTVAPLNAADTFRVIRDSINAAGSNPKSLNEAQREQGLLLKALQADYLTHHGRLIDAANEVAECRQMYEVHKEDFLTSRQPLVGDIRDRIGLLPKYLQWLGLLMGPVLLVILAATITYARITDSSWVNELLVVAVADVFLWGALFVLFILRYRR